jgi:hypothetical protein
VLVVNSASAAKAIFLGHSNALSSRPVFYTFHKVDVYHAASQLLLTFIRSLPRPRE